MCFSKTSYFFVQREAPLFLLKKPRSASALFAKFWAEELSSSWASFTALKIDKSPYSFAVHRNCIFNKKWAEIKQSGKKTPIQLLDISCAYRFDSDPMYSRIHSREDGTYSPREAAVIERRESL